MKTLADLKRALKVGKRLLCVYGPKPGAKREVIKVQTNAVVLISPEDPDADKLRERGKGIYLDIPNASLIEVTDTGFKIYHPGRRDLTGDEKQVIVNEPIDPKQDEIDALSDGSTMFWRRKRYYEERGYGYLFLGDKNRRIDTRDRTKVIDSSVKGDLALEYVFEN